MPSPWAQITVWKKHLEPAEAWWLQVTPETSTERHISGTEQSMQHTEVAGELFGFRPSRRGWLAGSQLWEGLTGLRTQNTSRIIPCSSCQCQGDTAKFKLEGGQGVKFKPAGGTWSVTGWLCLVPASQPGTNLNFSGKKLRLAKNTHYPTTKLWLSCWDSSMWTWTLSSTLRAVTVEMGLEVDFFVLFSFFLSFLIVSFCFFLSVLVL